MPYEMHPIGTRIKLRATFDQVAQLYDEMRPSYPDGVFKDVLQISGVTPKSHLLEIGCGTGRATLILAARGFTIHALELGENMAGIARERLAAFPNVSIEVADFDGWNTSQRFDLVYAATSFHWLNPATREQRIAGVLNAGGWLAIWRNRHIRNGSSDDFLDELQAIYRQEAPQLTKRRALLPGPDQVIESERDEFSTRLFAPPIYRRYLWSCLYSSTEYIQMLQTHSDHQLLPAGNRARLFDRIANIIETRYNGSITKDYATILQIAQKIEPARQ